MAGLMGEHADDLVRRFRLHHRAIVDEDAPSVGHEGVERALVDDHHLDVVLFETGGAQNGTRVVAQQLLGLGIADHGGPAILLGGGNRRRKRDRRRRDQRGEFGGVLVKRWAKHGTVLQRDDYSSNCPLALSFCLSMIFSENRCPCTNVALRVRIMLWRLAAAFRRDMPLQTAE